jgi:RND family efflux transporter MFP subunit
VIGGQADLERSLPGRVEATRQVDLSFRVGGPLIELRAREGEDVAKGQLLARIDPRDYEIRLNSARADHEKAEADYRRLSALYEKDAVSKAQLDQAKATRDVAAAAMDDAEANLADTRLLAPFASRVGETFVENFQDVQPKEGILSLVDVGAVDIKLDVPEGIVARFRGNLGRLTARFDAAPGKEFELEVKEIAAQADPATQTFRVTLNMPQPDDLNLLPGMTASVVHFRPGTGEAGRITIPAIAVFADESGSSHVWALDPDDNTVHRRKVSTGELSGSSEIEIDDGLQPGDTIAVSAISQLHDGMQIRPVQEDGGR